MIKQKEVHLPERGAAAVILAWFTGVGKDVYEGLPLAVFHYVGSSEQITFKAPCEGVVEKLHPIKVEVEAGAPIMVLSVCTHDIQFHQMCGICGKDLTQQHFSRTQTNVTNLTLIHSQPELKVSRQEAERDAQSTAKRLLTHKKLSLILDLDQTLVHATNDLRVEALYAEKVKKQEQGIAISDQENDPLYGLHRFQLDGPVKSNNIFFVKERPHLREFLEEAHKMFELHIYTMGTRKYAEEVARLIDPSNTLFRENIVSRDDTPSIDFKSIQRIFPCDDSMVIIVDDRVDVWGTCKNLIHIDPFLFFHDTKVNALPRDQHQHKGPVPHRKSAAHPEQEKKRKREEEEDKTPEKEKGESETQNKPDPTSEAPAASGEPSTKKQKTETTESEVASSTTTPSSDTPSAAPSKEATTPAAPFMPYIPRSMKDKHLLHILNQLKEVHKLFYAEIEEKGGDQDKGKEKETDKEKEKEKEEENSNLRGSGKRRRRTKEDEDEDEIFWNEDKGTHLVKDVKYYLYLARKHILKGVHILFSGIFPLDTVPETTTLWMVAEAFGAICHSSAASMPQVTHLVASKAGTDKVKEASAMTNIKIVHVHWLLASFKNYQKADESLYPLPEASRGKGVDGGGLSVRDLQFVTMLYTAYVEGLRELIDRCEKKKMREYRALRRSSSGGLGDSKNETDMDKFLESVLGKSADDDEDEEDEEDEDDDDDEEASDYGDTGSEGEEEEKEEKEESEDTNSSSNMGGSGGSDDEEAAELGKMLEEELGRD